MKKMIHFIVSGIIWSLCYALVMGAVGILAFQFNPFDLQFWNHYYSAFIKGYWVIYTTQDVLLALYMLLFIPIWIIGWWITYRCRTRKKGYVAPRIKADISQKNTGHTTPQRISAQTNAVLTATPTAPTVAVQPVPPPSIPQPSDNNQDAEIRAIMAAVEPYDLMAFSNIMLEGNHIALSLSTEDTGIIIKIINDANQDWSIDITDALDTCDWYSQSKVLHAPAAEIKRQAERLMEMEPDATVIPTLVLTNGYIINATDALTFFDKFGVRLLSFNKTQDNLPDLIDLVAEIFGPKTDETDQMRTEISDEIAQAKDI